MTTRAETPASPARWRASRRSPSNSGSWRWQWESISMSEAQPGLLLFDKGGLELAEEGLRLGQGVPGGGHLDPPAGGAQGPLVAQVGVEGLAGERQIGGE